MITQLRTALTTAWFLANRSIRRGNIGVLLTTIAMMSLIYVQLLFIPGLIQAAIDNVEQQLIETSSADVRVGPPDGTRLIADSEALVADLDALPEVASVATVRIVGSEVATADRSGSFPVLAVHPVDYAKTFTTPAHIIDGRWLETAETGAIVLGIGVAGDGDESKPSYSSSLRTVEVGDTVEVGLVSGQTASFTVVGIYENRFIQSDAQAFVTTAAADALIPSTAGQASSIFMSLTEPKLAADVAADVTATSDLTVETWEAQLQSISEQVRSFDLIKQILRVVSLVVAAIAIMIITYVDLAGKRRTIGIERAIGIRSEAIVTSYSIKAVVFSLIGVAAGVALMYGVVLPLNRRYPFSFPNGDVVISVDPVQLRRDGLLLAVVALVAALLPSIRFVRTRILDAIWG